MNEAKPTAAFFWRRLDHPGHDSCRLFKVQKGWRLIGAAVFSDNSRPCHLQYEVVTDAAWKSRRARVVGFVGNRAVELRVRVTRGLHWAVNGVEQRNVSGCIDIDLGFTPATNLIALRRLALKIGQRAEASAAYLAFPKMRFERLPQTYHRMSRTQYGYEAPSFGYSGTLTVSPFGAVVRYPGLFEKVERNRIGAHMRKAPNPSFRRNASAEILV
jgi:uncharacterized protein